MICVLNTLNVFGDPTVAVILSQDAGFLTKEGNPFSGVALTPERARSLANELIKSGTEHRTMMCPGR